MSYPQGPPPPYAPPGQSHGTGYPSAPPPAQGYPYGQPGYPQQTGGYPSQPYGQPGPYGQQATTVVYTQPQ